MNRPRGRRLRLPEDAELAQAEDQQHPHLRSRPRSAGDVMGFKIEV
jgi:hypothetical protein